MSNNAGQKAPATAPPLLIGLCILGAVITVIVTAALYKMCRHTIAEADPEAAATSDMTWNPNQPRSAEQTQYMEEVRMRNKMFAWERAREGKNEEYEAYVWGKGYDGKEISTEEYLDEISLNDNPYEGIVGECMKRQSHQFQVPKQPSPKFPRAQAYNGFMPTRFSTPSQSAQSTMPVPHDAGVGRTNNSGVRIVVNDEGGEVLDFDQGYEAKWVC